MSVTLKHLLNKSNLKEISEPLSLVQLEAILNNLNQLIAEQRQTDQERELSRKGARALDDMRGLMAKAGISMTDFQKALDDL